jgi:Flp pilus assembly protein TadD
VDKVELNNKKRMQTQTDKATAIFHFSKSAYITAPTQHIGQIRAAANSGFKKLAVQWLNEALCFVSSSVLADSFVLRNPPLRQAPKR